MWELNLDEPNPHIEDKLLITKQNLMKFILLM